MSQFKEFGSGDRSTTTTTLSQLIDIVQSDVSGSSTRKTYGIFVTASTPVATTYSVTSSLFQTVYDQDYTLQVSNAMFDIALGLYESGSTVLSASFGVDSNGKRLFPTSSLMMREKIEMYKLFASKLLGDADSRFFAPYTNTDTSSAIDEALFVPFKRLFSRDGVKKNSFAMRFYSTASLDGSSNAQAFEKSLANSFTGSNVFVNSSTSGSHIYTDAGISSFNDTPAGQVGKIINASDSNDTVGLMFYDAGVAVFDLKRICFRDQHMSGTISAVTGASVPVLSNQTIMGRDVFPSSNPSASFIPDFVVSASMDDFVNHIATTRFQSGSLTAITFQNQTKINSTLFFCRANANEFNFSSNPTYVDDAGQIIVKPDTVSDAKTFTYPTTVGLYDVNNNLLAVAKLGRPVEKNDEQDLTIRVRLDF